YGPKGIELMESGVSAKDVLKKLTDQDEGRDFRQAAILDINGSVSAFTGEKCIESAGHFVGDNFSVQANMMLNDKVIPAMKKAFLDNSDLPLAERIIKVFEAAESVGGDIRGKQSAALIVVGAKKTSNVWEDKKIDLRVDDNINPIKEIKRLLKVHRAYEHMNKGDLAIEENDMEKALSEYGKAQVLFPENHEMSFWKAIALLNNGKKEAARPILKRVFKENSNWKKLIYRLPKSGIIIMKSKELDSYLKDL
ncbi:MAG: putative Ntn-hydrolase superfamily protein, partial [Candidatus Marivariicella framensis]